VQNETQAFLSHLRNVDVPAMQRDADDVRLRASQAYDELSNAIKRLVHRADDPDAFHADVTKTWIGCLGIIEMVRNWHLLRGPLPLQHPLALKYLFKLKRFVEDYEFVQAVVAALCGQEHSPARRLTRSMAEDVEFAANDLRHIIARNSNVVHANVPSFCAAFAQAQAAGGLIDALESDVVFNVVNQFGELPSNIWLDIDRIAGSLNDRFGKRALEKVLECNRRVMSVLCDGERVLRRCGQAIIGTLNRLSRHEATSVLSDAFGQGSALRVAFNPDEKIKPLPAIRLDGKFGGIYLDPNLDSVFLLSSQYPLPLPLGCALNPATRPT
jgi:hypothetical protein